MFVTMSCALVWSTIWNRSQCQPLPLLPPYGAVLHWRNLLQWIETLVWSNDKLEYEVNLRSTDSCSYSHHSHSQSWTRTKIDLCHTQLEIFLRLDSTASHSDSISSLIALSVISNMLRFWARSKSRMALKESWYGDEKWQNFLQILSQYKR